MVSFILFSQLRGSKIVEITQSNKTSREEAVMLREMTTITKMAADDRSLTQRQTNYVGTE